MSDLMYYCTFAALRCSLGFAWTIITLIKSTSLEESGQRQRKGERGDVFVCIYYLCFSLCMHFSWSVCLSLHAGDYTGTEIALTCVFLFF